MGSLIGCSLVALLLTGSGLGARTVDAVVQDDATFLHRSDAEVRAAADVLAALGTDQVRLTAGWSVLAPAPRARRRPRGGFDARDSRTYREPAFAALDRAVREVDRAGMEPTIDLAFWAPRWAVARPSSNPDRHRESPDPEAFADFARAVAERYSGDGRDHGGDPLPRVRTWTTWNEPNHVSFLAPQWTRDARGGEGWRPASPHVYRPMHEAAYDEIKAVSASNTVLAGGLSSFGSPVPGEGSVPPLDFLRALACVDRELEPLRVPECADAGPVRADGFAYHPYSLDAPPGTPAPGAGDAFVADLGKLSALLGDLHAAGRTSADWPLHLTEYGYETDPPDPTAAWSPDQQAHFLGWAAHLGRAEPRVRTWPQFLLYDIDAAESGLPPGDPGRWSDWQTGLLFHDGRPKPAAAAWALPLHAFRTAGGALALSGQVRPGAGRQVVRVERLDRSSGDWRGVETSGIRCADGDPAFVTGFDGDFTVLAEDTAPGTYRLAWRRPGAPDAHGPPIPLP